MELGHFDLCSEIRPSFADLFRRAARIQTPLQFHRKIGDKRHVGGTRGRGKDYSHCGEIGLAAEAGLGK
jgi:hypothetical protein